MRILGTVGWTGHDRPEAAGLLAQPRRLALLAYLAAAAPRGARRRDHLVAMFWPELDQERARAALRQALFVIRSALGGSAVIARGAEEVELDEAAVWCDVPAFERACDAGAWMEALDLYRGDLLEGFFISEAPEFERWLDDERRRLRGRAAQAARALGSRSEAAGDLTAAAEWSRRALHHAPNDEPTFRELLDRLDRLGDRAGAARAYEEFTALLAKDLEVEPSSETQRLMAAIRSRTDGRAGGAAPAGVAGAGPGAGAAAASPRVVAGRGRPAAGPWRTIARHPAYAVLAAVALAGVALGGRLALRGHGPALNPRRVVVAPFANRTGDPALDAVGDLAADWTSRSLLETGLVDVADRGAGLLTGRAPGPRSGRGTPRPAEPSDADALAAATGAGIAVWGAIDGAGDSLALTAFVTDVRSHRLLRSVGPVAVSRRDVGPAISTLSDRVIGSLATVLDPKLAAWAGPSAQPPSFDAYLTFSQGVQAWLVGLDSVRALTYFQRAAAIDSTYTLPLVWEAWILRARGRCADVDSIARALAAPGRALGRVERLQVDREVADCHEERQRVYDDSRQLAELMPGSELMAALLARSALDLGRDSEAIAILDRLHPDRGELAGYTPYFLFLTQAWHALGRHREELAAAERARRQYPDNAAEARLEMIALAALGRSREVDERAAALAALPKHTLRRPGEILLETALELMSHGHADAAPGVAAQALAWYGAQQGPAASSPPLRFERAVLLEVTGHADSASAVLNALVRRGWKTNAAVGLAGVLAAERGDSAAAWKADSLLAASAAQRGGWSVELWRARVAASRGDVEGAFRYLDAAAAAGMPRALPTGRLPLDAPYGSFLHVDFPLRRLWNDPRLAQLDGARN